jgi:hypothetical protein
MDHGIMCDDSGDVIPRWCNVAYLHSMFTFPTTSYLLHWNQAIHTKSCLCLIFISLSLGIELIDQMHVSFFIHIEHVVTHYVVSYYAHVSEYGPWNVESGIHTRAERGDQNKHLKYVWHDHTKCTRCAALQWFGSPDWRKQRAWIKIQLSSCIPVKSTYTSLWFLQVLVLLFIYVCMYLLPLYLIRMCYVQSS